MPQTEAGAGFREFVPVNKFLNFDVQFTHARLKNRLLEGLLWLENFYQ